MKHTKDVAAIKAALRKKDEELKLERTPGEATYSSLFAAMRDSATRLPPSQYANFVLAYAEKFPAKGHGKNEQLLLSGLHFFE